MNLHGQIINLPCEPEDGQTSEARWNGYAAGHRDARHAAAELALAADAEIDRLREENARLRGAAMAALEALETCTPADYSTGHVIHADYDTAKCAAAEEALRAALKGTP